ncbi:MAG: integrin alpha, partial [Candidatus Binatia bacterium]
MRTITYGSVLALFLMLAVPASAQLRHQKINADSLGRDRTRWGDWFGKSVANLGDLDGDGVNDLAVGAPRVDDGGDIIYDYAETDSGAVWIVF